VILAAVRKSRGDGDTLAEHAGFGLCGSLKTGGASVNFGASVWCCVDWMRGRTAWKKSSFRRAALQASKAGV